MSQSSRTRRLGTGTATALALGTTAVLLAPSAASAAATVPVVSQAQGQLVDVSLGGQPIDDVLELAGAVAVNPDGQSTVTENTPLDATALSAITLSSGNIPLLGDNGIIRLGAVGQYAQAQSNGGSTAFAGTVSSAPSLIGVDTVESGNVGSPSAGDAATIVVGTSTLGLGDALALDIGVSALAASAVQGGNGEDPGDPAGAATGQYDIAGLEVAVTGAELQQLLSAVNTALAPVLTLVGVTSPIDPNGAVVVTLDDLLAAAGVASLNDLAPGTDLLQYLPQAVVTEVTSTVDELISTLNAEIGGLTQGQVAGLDLTSLDLLGLGGLLGGILGALTPVTTVITSLTDALADIVTGTIAPLLDGLLATLAPVVSSLAQLTVNNQTLNADGSFTQNALTLGLGADGSIAEVALANATVGPNAGISGIPLASIAGMLIVGAIALGGGAWYLVNRRRTAGATLAPAAA
ncbi:choice-of-anchor G family protein [Arenivirga flava]|uniref:Choice-of-anchor G family protein n=1 Tax=Arenivirga flava TaxID=1930060 RepID=A0AA37UH91_9MICO|nr:choice-of-anchor G family protein [Arenivirga flava]GMA28819.1 hypothetical protein GCM10025874_20720 [Arenivirga flava]